VEEGWPFDDDTEYYRLTFGALLTYSCEAWSILGAFGRLVAVKVIVTLNRCMSTARLNSSFSRRSPYIHIITLCIHSRDLSSGRTSVSPSSCLG
jgi:hypothetical protein